MVGKDPCFEADILVSIKHLALYTYLYRKWFEHNMAPISIILILLSRNCMEIQQFAFIHSIPSNPQEGLQKVLNTSFMDYFAILKFIDVIFRLIKLRYSSMLVGRVGSGLYVDWQATLKTHRSVITLTNQTYPEHGTALFQLV